MRVIEFNSTNPELEALLAVAEREDVVLASNGHPRVRIEKFTAKDLDDWLFEHDPKVIQGAEAAKERLRQGGGISLEHLSNELGI